MSQNKRRWMSIALTLMLFIPLLSGCLNVEPADSDEPKVLKILGYNEETVRREWTQLYEISHPEVTIEVIPMEELYRNPKAGEEPKEAIDFYKEKMTGPNAPDVVLLDMDVFPKLIDEGLLAPLESYIEKSKFDIENIVPVVREGIRSLGGGTLYGLAPNFSGSALFYNKNFFDNRGIPYPTDKMTWEEVFNLARQLKYEENGETKYGFSFSPYSGGDIYWQMQNYVAPLGLTMFDEELKTINVNTPQWEKIWSTFINLKNEGLTPPPFDWEKYNRDGLPIPPFADHDFISGRAAMTIMNYNEIRWMSDVLNGNYYYGSEDQRPESFEWDVVTVPVHPEAPDVGGGFYLNGLMAINANAQNPDLAWDFISFINSEEVAKVRAKASWDMVSRAKYIQPISGLNIHMEAFYTLNPAPINDEQSRIYQKFRNQNPWELMDLGRQQFEAALNGEKTVQEALAEFQKKGQELLDRLNSGQGQQNNGGGAIIY